MYKAKNKNNLTKSQIEAVALFRDLQLKLNAEQKKSAYWTKKSNEQELIINDLKNKIDALSKKKGGKNG